MLRLAYLIAMSGGWALRVYDERHQEGEEAWRSNRVKGSASARDVADTARWERHRKSRSKYHSLLRPPTRLAQRVLIGIGAVRSAWVRVTRRAALDGMLVHDPHRTAARDFRRAGVSEGEIMKLCGWRTRSMFDRYNIIDVADLGRCGGDAIRQRQTSGKPLSLPRSPRIL